MDISKIQSKFTTLFGSQPLLFRSPGRINIIGEHTDYNEGFVLPAAIDKAVIVAVAKRDDETIKLYAEKYSELFEIQLSEVLPSAVQWANYILGVVAELQTRGHKISGFELLLDGDIPGGAGLSSSAAIECAVVFALNDMYDLKIDKLEMVKIAQKAEHNFAGVMCGIMDQFASMFGKENHALRLDCKTLEYKYVPLNLPGYKIVLLNTNVKHNLASSAYNKRRASCFQGVEWVKAFHPEVNSLRDVSLEMLNAIVKEKDEDVYVKCKFIVEEIERLQSACVALEANDIVSLGAKMFETHDGLSKAYEVSCEELDYLVDQVRDNPNVIGSRMMGGGFGGCTINIVKEDTVDALIEQLATKYEHKFGLKLDVYAVKIEDGSGVVKIPSMHVN